MDENQCFTSPKLLDMLRSSAKVPKQKDNQQAVYDSRMEKWSKKYGKGEDSVMESSLEWRQEEENTYPYGIGKNYPPDL